jgi:hypothetical protein
MALHIELPIYKLAYDLFSMTADLTRNMPRDFKASVGAQLRIDCVALIVCIGRANQARVKTSALDALLEHLQVIELLLRLAHDKKHISPGQWARAVQLTDKIGQQAGGWRRWAQGQGIAAPSARPLPDGQGHHA